VIVLAAGRVRLQGSIEELTKPVVPRLRLAASGPLATCAAVLQAGGIAATLHDATTLLLPEQDAAGIERLWQAVRETGVVVRALAPERRGFEEVFLQAIAGQPDGEERPGETTHAPS